MDTRYNLWALDEENDRIYLVEEVGSEQEANAVAIPVSQALRGKVQFNLTVVGSPEDDFQRIMAEPDKED